MKATRGIVLALALLASGCFTMRHELPAVAHFGGRSEAAPAGTPLDRAAAKNYAPTRPETPSLAARRRTASSTTSVGYRVNIRSPCSRPPPARRELL